MKGKIMAEVRFRRAGALALAAAGLSALCATGAFAQAAPAATTTAAPSTNATVNLIRLLIKSKVITQAAGDALLQQAETEAAQARAALALQTPPVVTADAGLPPAAEGTIRVPYIPESLRAKITDDIRKDVLDQANFEGWARPNQLPEWVKGIRLYGDIRFRSQSDFYSNNNELGLIDFQAFNDQSPIDINANTNPTGFPILNSRTDRTNRFRIRARLGLAANISDHVQAAFRIASGDDNSPISTNQTLGGGLAKKNIWLDQAYLKLSPVDYASVSFGRFPNPFGSPTQLLFDDDLNFDGVSATIDARHYAPANTTLALTVGAFPLGFSSANFPNNADTKSSDRNRWLFSGQLKGTVRVADKVDIAASGAYHDFKSIQGQLSAPCALYNGNRQCSTDDLRPTFLRKGNTLFLTRNILPDPASPLNFAQPQLLGLAFDYRIVNINASAHMAVTDKLGIDVGGDYVRNLGFKRSDLCRNAPIGLPVNNITQGAAIPASAITTVTDATRRAALLAPYISPCTPDPDPLGGGRIAHFDGGNQGYTIYALFGTKKPAKWGEWNVEASYRYLESDAVLDSLTDSDFHLGGTNTKGYTIGGTLGLFKNVSVGGRWLSANAISGPPLAIDVLQIDLQAAF